MEKLKEVTVQAYCRVASGCLVELDVPQIFQGIDWESVPNTQHQAGSFFQEVVTARVPLYLIEQVSCEEKEDFWHDDVMYR